MNTGMDQGAENMDVHKQDPPTTDPPMRPQTEHQDQSSLVECVEETVILRLQQLEYLRISNFPRDIMQKFQNLQILMDCSTNKHQIQFKGLPGDVMNAKMQMYEMVSQLQVEVITDFPLLICQLLTQTKTRNFIGNEFGKANVVVVYEVNKKQVIFSGQTEDDIQSGVSVLRKSVIDYTLELTGRQLTVSASPDWQDELERLKKNADGELMYQTDPANKFVVLAATDPVMKDTVRDLQIFLDEKTVLEKFVNLDNGTTMFLDNFKQADLKQIEKNCCVMLSVERNPTKPGIKAQGNKHCLQHAVGQVQKLVHQMICVEYWIHSPHMLRFLNCTRGHAFIKNVEIRCHVAIEYLAPGKSDISGPFESSPDIEVKFQVDLGPQIKVYIVKGDITKLRVDAIVDATNGRLELVGGVAAAISKKGGVAIQQECNSYITQHGDLLPGDCFVSSAGCLPCKHIIHTVGPKWQTGLKSEKDELFEAVHAVLTKASELSCTSIALPAISTGVDGSPKLLCAQTIMEAVKSFITEARSSTIQDIHLVDVDEEMINHFKTTGEEAFGQHTVKQHGVKKPTSTVEDIEMATLTAAGPSGSGAELGTSLTPSDPAVVDGADSVILVVFIGNVTIQVAIGDITCQSTDAIVNSTGENLPFNSFVSKAILKKAGEELLKECQKIGKVNTNSIAVTSAGDLPCKHIIHVCAPDGADGFFSKKWKTRVTSCLEEAEKLKLKSISFPALGTGKLKLKLANMATTMMNAIVAFAPKAQSLCLIRVVVFESTMLSAFTTALQNAANANGFFLKDETEHEGPEISAMTFAMYGQEGTQGVSEAKTMIAELSDNESQEKVLSSDRDQQTIARLDQDQISTLEAIAKDHNVTLSVRQGKCINRVRMQGQNKDLTVVLEEVYRIFREIDELDYNRKEAGGTES